ncbi:MAG TPA: beta-ketoacyl-ACP synthase II [Anaerolineae bacterium]|nr:beta-ketoacyl-ACP synthase II [Anaerolineae bacterium]HID83736.1 beta-ketoacyl-[acyl-carrier-protein] synthase II [Anaerolineales bacterium]HIQ09784.1 beta-ketoacyl-[acyl-carrier-protein] synthase II [Anaerolineaceae bacterium]
MTHERIVITGMGTVNPVGHSVQETWENILAGVSGVGPITLFDASDIPVRIAAEVKAFDPEAFGLSRKDARRMSRNQLFALAAAREAIAQAGLDADRLNPERIGVLVSSAIGGLEAIEANIRTMITTGPRRVSPMVIPMLMPNGAAGLTAMRYGFQGPALSIDSACATGIDSLGIAWYLIKAGVIDVAVAGGTEATITQSGVVAFDRTGAMSRRNEDYQHTPRPFDKNRDGLVMGEGAGVLVIERESHAKARGAEILAELAGYAATADAYHITSPHPEGDGAMRAIRDALASAGEPPEAVDHISAHGTGTQLNDAIETKAIKRALGEHAYRVPISSTKSMTGHMMGATGGLETIFCVQAIQEGVVPPTINYETPDPECDLDYVPNEPREVPVRVALNNAFGFGGHNAVIVVRRYE